MSTVSVSNIKNASSSVNNAVTTSGGDLTNAAGVSFMGGSKNLLYNGAMQVAQRGTSVASITTTGYRTADRWTTNLTALGTWTQSVENDAPTGSGLRKSLKMLCTTADSSPAAADELSIDQILEGQDLQRIAKGTASAQQLTLSFWVKSNVTGTYVAWLYDNDNTRHVGATYAISASATWERKVISFPADTTGAFDNDNAASLIVRWWLGVGSDRTSGTLATSWASYTAANAAVGQTNLAAATNNYWQVTGVQLEVGPVATSFEFKSFGQELAECQRYYWRSTAPAQYGVVLPGTLSTSTTAFVVFVNNPVPMRAAIAAVDYANIYIAQRTTTSADATVTSLSASDGSTVVSSITGGVASGLTANHAGSIRASVANGYVGVSAEL